MLTWHGTGEHHAKQVLDRLAEVLDTGRTAAFDCGCRAVDCPLRWAVAAPIVVDQRVLGALVAYAPRESAVLARATDEVARWVSVQFELAELDRSRTRLIEAEIKALRAQISPHFIFNSLAAIASFVRTDPTRARELLLEFADFTRYSFRRHGEFTTLADELHSIDQYLALVRARFGDRLSVTLQIAPEVLAVTLPFLCLQPLVENAVKHGLEGAVTRSRITITAQDAGAEAEVVIEDDGVGMDPDRLRALLRGEGGPSAGVGLLNVDERLRTVFGDPYGLVIETARGAGTRITVRIPKFRAGVHSSPPEAGSSDLLSSTGRSAARGTGWRRGYGPCPDAGVPAAVGLPRRTSPQVEAASYAWRSCSEALGPVGFSRGTPRWISRSSAMSSPTRCGEPARTRARTARRGVVGRWCSPQVPRATITGRVSMLGLGEGVGPRWPRRAVSSRVSRPASTSGAGGRRGRWRRCPPRSGSSARGSAASAEDHVTQHDQRPRVAQHLDRGVDRTPRTGLLAHRVPPD
ncbi:sensor histidine kinase [Actinomadura keratinilytica]